MNVSCSSGPYFFEPSNAYIEIFPKDGLLLKQQDHDYLYQLFQIININRINDNFKDIVLMKNPQEFIVRNLLGFELCWRSWRNNTKWFNERIELNVRMRFLQSKFDFYYNGEKIALFGGILIWLMIIGTIIQTYRASKADKAPYA